MSINGIQSVIQGVDDLDLCERFFSDFGLLIAHSTPHERVFSLEEGCKLVLRHADDPSLPSAWYEGQGMREIVLGVDTVAALEELVRGLSSDRTVRRDPDGTAHFRADDGTAFGLIVYQRHPLESRPDPVNAPGHITRPNRSRQWRTGARPKRISHVVLCGPDYAASARFVRDRLGFRLSDHQPGFAAFMRADGTSEHHTIAFTHANAARYHHMAFTVDDIDEVMAGANHMKRRGWTTQGIHVEAGLGRHRVSSALFYYLKSPGGGEAEYSADSDCLDDEWEPRVWYGLFGYSMWTHEIPAALAKEDAWHPQHWNVRPDPGGRSLDEALRRECAPGIG